MTKKIFLFTALSIAILAAEASAKRLAVNVNRANVRSGPGTNHEILWSVGKYYPFDILDKSGNWYRVRDFEGDVGWMYQPLLKRVMGVIVKAPLVNVRNGPGTGFRILFQAEKGVSFKRVGKKGKWFKVQHADGDVGWIHESLVWGD